MTQQYSDARGAGRYIMTTLEKTELALIVIAAMIIWLVAQWLPARISVTHLILLLAVILLTQSLLRDIAILVLLRHKQGGAGPARYASCMCVESTLGLSAVVCASALLLLGMFHREIAINRWGWTLSIFAVMLSCFLLKDFVLQWRPWRLYKDKEHLNIVFSWRGSQNKR